MIRILLISPYSDIYGFGVRSLGAYLKKYGGNDCCVVRQLFLPQRSAELLREVSMRNIMQFIGNGYDLIGISVITNTFQKAKLLSESIRKYSKAVLIWGGIHPTVSPEECLNHCDLICLGEGEGPLLGIVRKMFLGRDYRHENNVAFLRKGEIVINSIRSPIENLDTIPAFDYDTNSNFILSDDGIVPMTEDILKSFMGNNFTTITSRGCIYNCAYCCNDALCSISTKYRNIRRQSPQKIIDDLSSIKKKLDFIEHITFDDDDFLSTSFENLRLFCDLYSKRIGLPFYVTGLLPTTITAEKLGVLTRAGLVNVRLGIQSGSERVNREIYNRSIPLSKVRKSVEIINQFKRFLKLPRYDIILDNPWESEEEQIETIRLCNDLPRPFTINKFSLTLYPGTALFRMAMRENRIRDIEEQVYTKRYKRVANTYLNLLIYILSVTKIPKPILEMLLWLNKKKLVSHVPYSFFAVLDFVDVVKRNVFLLRKFKLGAFMAIMKYSLKLR